MAKKVKKLEVVEAPNVKPLIFDKAEARKTMATYKGKSLKDIGKSMKSLASTLTEGGIQRSLFAAAFWSGVALRKTGATSGNFNDEFDVFAKDHWGAAPPDADTLKTYRSQYNAAFEAGMAPFNAAPVIEHCISILNIRMSERATTTRKLLKDESGKPRTAANPPSIATIEAAFAPKPGRTGTHTQSAEGVCSGLINAGVNAAGNPEVQKYLLDPANAATALVVKPFLDAAVASRMAAIPHMKAGSKSRKGYEDSIAKVNAAVAAVSAANGRRARGGRRLDS